MKECAKSEMLAQGSGNVESRSHASDTFRFWRSLEELSNDPRVLQAVQREFPSLIERVRDEPSRRDFIRVMGASLALAGMAGCMRQPEEQIVPYVRAHEQILPGKPLCYATAMTLAGSAIGL